MRLLSALFLCAALLHSEDVSVDPQKAALIRQIVQASDSDQLRQRLINTLVVRRGVTLRNNPAYPVAYVDELEKKLKERVSTMDLPELMTPIYAQTFTVDELTQILAFRTSPVGRKLAAVEPQIMIGIFKRGSDAVTQLTAEIDKEIFAEHPEYEKQIRERQPATEGAGDQSLDHLYRIGGDVSAPGLINKTEPTYSEEARKAKLSGGVLLTLVVDANGVPRNIRVLRSLGLGLDEKAIEAVSKWRFRPAMKQGAPVACIAQVEVNFRLLEKPQ